MPASSVRELQGLVIGLGDSRGHAGITAIPGDCGVFRAACTEGDLPMVEQLSKVGVGFDPEVEEEFANDRSVRDSPAAATEIERLLSAGFARTFDSYQACRDRLGHAPQLSKLAWLEKFKDGKTKHRRILDCRRWADGWGELCVNAAARVKERAIQRR